MQWLAKFEESERRKEGKPSLSPSVSKGEELCDLDEIYNSDDDDEPRFGSDSTGLSRFSSLKTDIELNSAATGVSHKSLAQMPMKAQPAVVNKHHWAVSWKPRKQVQ